MDQARHFLTQFTGTQAYLVFYFVLVGCGIGFPFNSDLTLISASVLAALGYFKLPFLIPIAFLGLLSGDTINFFVARKYGPRILTRAPFRWILSPEKVSSAEKFLEENGTRFLFCVRFLPLIRTALFFTAGSLQVKPKTFYLLNGVATIIYLSILMNLAFYAGENIDSLVSTFKHFQFFLLGSLILLVLAVIIRRKMKGPILS